MSIDKLLLEPNAYESICNKIKENPIYLQKVFDARIEKNDNLYHLLKNKEEGAQEPCDADVMTLLRHENLLGIVIMDHEYLRELIDIPRPTREQLQRFFDIIDLKKKYLSNRKRYSTDECKKKAEELRLIAVTTASIIEENKEECHVLILSNYVKFIDLARDIQSCNDILNFIELPEEQDKAMIKIQEWLDRRFPIIAQIKEDKQHLL